MKKVAKEVIDVLSPMGHDYWFMGQKCECNRKIHMNFVVKIAKSLNRDLAPETPEEKPIDRNPDRKSEEKPDGVPF